MSAYKLLINGELVDGAGGTADVINPATEKVVAACPIADVAQVNAAVAAAKAAFPAWSRRTVAERGQFVDQLANALMARQDEFADQIHENIELGDGHADGGIGGDGGLDGWSRDRFLGSGGHDRGGNRRWIVGE